MTVVPKRIEGRTKEEIEDWTLDKFLTFYSSQRGKKLTKEKRGDQWPDFWVTDNSFERIGIEIREVPISEGYNRKRRTEEIILQKTSKFLIDKNLNLTILISDRNLPLSDSGASVFVDEVKNLIENIDRTKDEYDNFFHDRISNVWVQIKEAWVPSVWFATGDLDGINTGVVDGEVQTMIATAIQTAINDKKDKSYGESSNVFLVMYLNKDFPIHKSDLTTAMKVVTFPSIWKYKETWLYLNDSFELIK